MTDMTDHDRTRQAAQVDRTGHHPPPLVQQQPLTYVNEREIIDWRTIKNDFAIANSQFNIDS
jgi:hypothetical protein